MESVMFWQPITGGLDFMSADRLWSHKFPLECSGEQTGLLRPLGFIESGLATAHGYGSSNIVYALRMFSRRPLDPETVRRTLVIMQRRVQNLRLCIRQLYGRRYFAEMNQQRVLFSTRHNDDWMLEYESQLQAVFDVRRGPLWCAVLLTMPAANAAAAEKTAQYQETASCRSDSADEQETANFSVVEATPGFSHTSMLVLNFCHAISDGASNAVFCNMFLAILNRLIGGLPVPDAADVRLQPPLEQMPLRPAEVGSLGADQLTRTLRQLWSLAFPPTNRYLQCFPRPPRPPQIRMRTHSLLLDTKRTRRFVAACRREQVTVHAAFTVAASVALHRIIHQHSAASTDGATLNVRSGHVVNFRRYLQPSADGAVVYGCYMGFFEADVDVDDTSGGPEQFWATARATGAMMRRRLDVERQPVTYCRLMQALLSTERWVRRQHTKDMPHVSHYFGTSNMGDLDRLFDASGEHVEVAQLVRTTNIGHDLGMVFAHMFHTLRGRLMYNLDYLVSAVTEQQAKQYAETTLGIIVEMSHDNAI